MHNAYLGVHNKMMAYILQRYKDLWHQGVSGPTLFNFVLIQGKQIEMNGSLSLFYTLMGISNPIVLWMLAVIGHMIGNMLWFFNV